MKNNDIGTAIAKIIALTGGALAGAILANWFDKALSDRMHERSDRDRERYAQGLTPLGEDRMPSQTRIIRIESTEEVPDSWENI